MRHHGRPHAAVKHVLEGCQLHRIQPGPVMKDGREGGMGVAVAVSVAGKVLGRGQYPLVLQTVGIGLPESTDPLHRFPKASASDDWIDGVGVDVDDRCKVDMDARGTQAAAHHLSKPAHQLGIPCGTQGHGPGERPRAVQAHAQAPFCIGGNHQRNAGNLLETTQPVALLFRPALHADDATQLQVPRPMLCFCPPGSVRARIDGDHQELGDTFLHAELGQNAVHVPCIFREKGGLLRAFLLLGVLGIVASHPEQERGHQRCQTRLQEGSAIRVRANDTRKLNCSSTVSSLLSTTTASSD